MATMRPPSMISEPVADDSPGQNQIATADDDHGAILSPSQSICTWSLRPSSGSGGSTIVGDARVRALRCVEAPRDRLA